MIRTFLALALTAALLPGGLSGQDTEGFSWTNTAELSYVSTSGNASSSTFGVKGVFEGSGGANALKFELGGVRASSEFVARRAVGTPEDFSVVETIRSETTAESYYARGRYDRDLGEAFGFTGLGWDRNTFSGVQNRYQFVGGFGRSFVESDAARFKADLGLTYTIQKDVDPAPGADEGFGGWRVSIDAMRALSETAGFRSVLVVNNRFSDAEDLRADWLNALSVSINSSLALKTSVQLLWDNVPSLLSIPLETSGGVPTGNDVLTPGDKLDTVITVAIVIQL
jgi:putative salt-induced outer membrane protein YdiY